jgi:peroxiredoxin/glutaredoxin
MNHENREGKEVPNVVFKVQENMVWKDITTDDIFKNKKVIVFSLPGAFTPTCTSSHVPGYDLYTPIFKKHGIDEVICLSVNDSFVMDQWKSFLGVKNLRFLSDGNGDFSQGMGLLQDFTKLGFGKRSWRYSMYVENKKIVKQFIEPVKEGDPFEVSDADTMFKYLLPKVTPPPLIFMFARKGCSHCARAKTALEKRSLQFEEVFIGEGLISQRSIKAVSGKTSTPQVYINGKHIGGADELIQFLDQHKDF